MNRQLETLQAIMNRAEPFLKEQPRKNWVKVRSISGVEALLFYSKQADKSEGVCLQYVDPNYCYCFNKEPQAHWAEIVHGTNPAAAMLKAEPKPF